jgi:glycosyltransferase involved in cell wall biosynthesis
MYNRFKSEKSLKSFVKFAFQSIVEFAFIDLCSNFIVDTTYVENRLIDYKIGHKILRMPSCVVIPQGINNNFFELRRNSTTTMNILSIGAFNRRKGHLELLDSFEQVLKTIPNLHLHIAGIISDLQYFEMLKDRILEKKMHFNVTLYPNVSGQKLNSLYENARLFVLHTQEESQGIVFCEAMALGLPIVTTNVGGIPYVLKQGVNALLSPYGDISLFSANLIKLFSDPSFEDLMSKTNLMESKLYNWRLIAIKVFNHYNSNKLS